jgi:hypothetical protein
MPVSASGVPTNGRPLCRMQDAMADLAKISCDAAAAAAPTSSKLPWNSHSRLPTLQVSIPARIPATANIQYPAGKRPDGGGNFAVPKTGSQRSHESMKARAAPPCFADNAWMARRADVPPFTIQPRRQPCVCLGLPHLDHPRSSVIWALPRIAGTLSFQYFNFLYILMTKGREEKVTRMMTPWVK